jgi:hypothetical protein
VFLPPGFFVLSLGTSGTHVTPKVLVLPVEYEIRSRAREVLSSFEPSDRPLLQAFFFGPDLKVPLSVRIRFFWASVQSLTALLRRRRTGGAEIFPVLIQYCSVARGTPAAFATSIVE